MHINRKLGRTHLSETDTFAYSLSSNHNPGYQMNCQSCRAIRVTSTAARAVHAYAMYLAVGIQRSRQRSATTTRIYYIFQKNVRNKVALIDSYRDVEV
ncbi:hypothetical protein JG688_00012182 [Phytophthora aleatoria]|uniref:Uncharacterized protein n=1 Tax=Phytophthora aleatoria TaxID=2496075 RepID=A0A8J5IJE1_9STRA|nr:hypothetical protein JG688_00012182 [Phytophthora aleatoria]